MGNSQYLEIFIEESRDHLQSINQSLLNLESSPDDMVIINEIFRSAHTLKGMAGTMGFQGIAKLTHQMENILDEVRNKKNRITQDMVDVFFEVLDQLELILNDIITSGSEKNTIPVEIIEKLAKIGKGNSSSTSSSSYKESLSSLKALPSLQDFHKHAISKARSQGLDALMVKIVLDDACLLKSARAFVAHNVLEDHGEIIYSNPSIEDIEQEKFEREFELILLTQTPKETIINDITKISEIEEVMVDEVFLDNSAIAASPDHANNDKPLSSQKTQENELHGRKTTSKSVRVDIERLDYLMNLVSELIIIKNTIENLGSHREYQDMIQSVEYLERITTDLHDAVMKVRMIPIEMVFNRFPRVVRDLSKATGKEIHLDIIGAETEVDRSIIDEIGDPLIHLLRNSIDHGVEAQEERIRQGKPIFGTIELKAYHDGNNVVVEVIDDGRGINIEKVAKKALDKGLITQSELKALSKNQVINYLFHPGFSTADKVTDISGRGVGLDVVKTKIETLGGTVEVDSTEGEGSRFIIRLPLTLSIIQALLIRISEEIYAFPISSVREILDIPSNDVKWVSNQEVIHYHGGFIPLINLAKTLGIFQKETMKDTLTVVVVSKGEKLYALVVDDLLGQQEIVIKTLGNYLSSIKVISGATILGNGSVALILDVNRLV